MNLVNVLLSTRILPINACIAGYIFWLMIGMQQPTNLHVQAPLCFYQDQEQYHVQAPDHVDIYIQSSRKTLHAIDARNTTAHININNLPEGTHNILITKKNLFLPNNVKLLHLKPANIAFSLIPISKDKETA